MVSIVHQDDQYALFEMNAKPATFLISCGDYFAFLDKLCARTTEIMVIH
jgi:hypothetical protein